LRAGLERDAGCSGHGQIPVVARLALAELAGGEEIGDLAGS